MRILIVEDNGFNGFCLKRVLEETLPRVQVMLARDSVTAAKHIEVSTPSLIILDGDLGAMSPPFLNGPALADRLMSKYPTLPIVAWTDSESMLFEFEETFHQHNKQFNEYNSWSKMISQQCIFQSLTYLFTAFEPYYYLMGLTINHRAPLQRSNAPLPNSYLHQ